MMIGNGATTTYDDRRIDDDDDDGHDASATRTDHRCEFIIWTVIMRASARSPLNSACAELIYGPNIRGAIVRAQSLATYGADRTRRLHSHASGEMQMNRAHDAVRSIRTSLRVWPTLLCLFHHSKSQSYIYEMWLFNSSILYRFSIQFRLSRISNTRFCTMRFGKSVNNKTQNDVWICFSYHIRYIPISYPVQIRFIDIL